jgi:hypothetical protein
MTTNKDEVLRQLTRYDPIWYGDPPATMEEGLDGHWVRYADVAALLVTPQAQPTEQDVIVDGLARAVEELLSLSRTAQDDQSKRIAELESIVHERMKYIRNLESLMQEACEKNTSTVQLLREKLVTERLAGFNECKEAAKTKCKAMVEFNINKAGAIYAYRHSAAADLLDEIDALTPSAPKGEQHGE